MRNNHLNWSLQTRLLQFPFIQHRLFLSKTPTNIPECSRCEVTKTYKRVTAVLESPHRLKSLRASTTKLCFFCCNAFQTCEPSYIRQLIIIQPPRSNRSSLYLSLPRPQVSPSLISLHRFLVCTSSLERTFRSKDLCRLLILLSRLVISSLLCLLSPAAFRS